MQTNNPFDLILSKLDQLQAVVNGLAENTIKPTSPTLPSPPKDCWI